MTEEPERGNETGAEAGNTEGGDRGGIGATNQPPNPAFVQALAQ